MLPPSLSSSSLGSGSFFNRKKTRSMLPCPEHQNTVTLVSDGREVEINYLPIRNKKQKSVLPCRPILQHCGSEAYTLGCGHGKGHRHGNGNGCLGVLFLIQVACL